MDFFWGHPNVVPGKKGGRCSHWRRDRTAWRTPESACKGGIVIEQRGPGLLKQEGSGGRRKADKPGDLWSSSDVAA
jgi:hypothetical protein